MCGNIGFPETVLILVIVLLIFGPKKIPEIGASLGKAIRGFRRAVGGREEEIPADQSNGNEEGAKKDIKADKGGGNPLLG